MEISSHPSSLRSSSPESQHQSRSFGSASSSYSTLPFGGNVGMPGCGGTIDRDISCRHCYRPLEPFGREAASVTDVCSTSGMVLSQSKKMVAPKLPTLLDLSPPSFILLSSSSSLSAAEAASRSRKAQPKESRDSGFARSGVSGGIDDDKNDDVAAYTSTMRPFLSREEDTAFLRPRLTDHVLNSAGGCMNANVSSGISNESCCAHNRTGTAHDNRHPPIPSPLLHHSAIAMNASTGPMSVATGPNHDDDSDDIDDNVNAFDSAQRPFLFIEFEVDENRRSRRQAMISTNAGQEQQRNNAAISTAAAVSDATLSSYNVTIGRSGNCHDEYEKDDTDDDVSSVGAASYNGDDFILVAPKELTLTKNQRTVRCCRAKSPDDAEQKAARVPWSLPQKNDSGCGALMSMRPQRLVNPSTPKISLLHQTTLNAFTPKTTNILSTTTTTTGDMASMELPHLSTTSSSSPQAMQTTIGKGVASTLEAGVASPQRPRSPPHVPWSHSPPWPTLKGRDGCQHDFHGCDTLSTRPLPRAEGRCRHRGEAAVSTTLASDGEHVSSTRCLTRGVLEESKDDRDREKVNKVVARRLERRENRLRKRTREMARYIDRDDCD